MAASERWEPGDVFVLDGVPGCVELLDRGVHVDGVPEHDAVEREAEGAELVLHA